MSLCPHRLVLLLFVAAVVSVSGSARADDVEAVKERLFQAKKDYDAEVGQSRKAVLEALDKQAEAAFKGANKRLLDQIETERQAFEKSGELPSTTPQTVRDRLTAAKTALDMAYATAVSDCIRLKAANEATAIEKEQKQFQIDSGIGNSPKARLDRAKAEYQGEMKQFREEVASQFDKREDAARDAGNKKLLDQVKAERKAFEGWGQLPGTLTPAQRQQPAAAKDTLVKAYGVAIKEFTKAKQDTEATVADKELQTLVRLVGTWRDADHGHIFVFKCGGAVEEFLPSGEPNTTGEWTLDAKGLVTLTLKNDHKVTTPLPSSEATRADVFPPRAAKPTTTLRLQRVLK